MRKNVDAARRRKVFVTFLSLGTTAKNVAARLIAPDIEPIRSMHGMRNKIRRRNRLHIQKRLSQMTKYVKKFFQLLRSAINYYNPRNLL